MKRTLQGMIEAGEPLMPQAIEALRVYHEAATAGLGRDDIERRRLLAESLYQAVSDYQLRALGGFSATLH
ncbi:hypothetical protein FEM01_16885 [Pseudomonas mosselii]|uniref:Uncharacterized protein n=2 Tax=Pseudomonas mosselii TaxID=78327 RepID=A0A5R8YUX7_9PSED|nr:hypothetical protein [Pseudomonas mosselii]TLP57289.1 hypothetical protein FEM01_16885 [Pseudomonas mosselii]